MNRKNKQIERVVCNCCVDGRLGAIGMTAKRPAVVVTRDGDIWIGNTTDSACTMGPVELFGFSTGTFEEVTLRGSLASGKLIDVFKVCKAF